MAKTFDQIYRQLGSVYDPSAQLTKKQIAGIPQSTQAMIQQADARKDQAFDQITNSARRRGMGFSGIPLGEQAEYASTEYAPAVANIKNSAEQRRITLLEALNSLNRDRTTQAQGMFDTNRQYSLAQRQFKESQRQFNEQQKLAREQMAAQQRAAAAAASGGAGSYLSAVAGGGGRSSGGSKPKVADEDAAYLGRLRSLPMQQQVAIIDSLRKSNNAFAKRRYKLGQQLGYWK